MSELFADIYEAIRNLRIQKGASEKDILKYIEERVGGCLKAANFMKTVRTLQKLVDEGVLMKKGKRFAFCSSFSKGKEEEEEEECEDNDEETELDMDDDECDEADGEEENDCEEEDEDVDEDEDDEDEEDEEDEDEDDDEDNGCDDKVSIPEKQLTSKDDSNSVENDPLKTSAKDKYILSSKKPSADTCGKTVSSNGRGIKSIKSKDDNGKNDARLASKETRNVIEQSSDVKSKEGEAIAFCVRDFIDSLYRPKSDCQDHEKLDKSDTLLQENMDEIEMDDVEKVAVNRQRKFRTKRGNQSRNTYRSRSPLKKIKTEKFSSLKRDHSDEMCYRVTSTQFLPEPMDADADIDMDKEADVVLDYDSCRHRSPTGPPPPNTPGVHLNRIESCCSAGVKEVDSHFEGDDEYRLKKNLQTKSSQMNNDMNGQNNWFPSEEGDKEQKTFKSDSPVDDELKINDEQRMHLCSCCEKKMVDT